MAESVTYVGNASSGGNRKSPISLSEPAGIQIYGNVSSGGAPTISGINSRDARLRGDVFGSSNYTVNTNKMGG